MLSRVANDYYPTPPRITHGLINQLGGFSGTLIEPCDGHGAISEVLRERCPEAAIVTNDPHPQPGNVPDFELDATDPASWNQFGAVDWVITNPPFNLANQIVPLAFKHADRGIAILLRMSWIEPTRDRAYWLEENADHLRLFMPVSPRPKFRADTAGSDSVTCAWFVWDKRWSWSRKDIPSPFAFLTNGSVRQLDLIS